MPANFLSNPDFHEVAAVMRRVAVVTVVLGVLASLTLPAGAQVPDLPPTPPRDQWYASNDTGHWSDGTRVRIDDACAGLAADEAVACSLEAFKAKEFVVMAFVDTGINPYHHDFRAPEFVHHPSTYVEGYPADTAELPLSFDVADAEGYAAARDADADVLAELERNTLRWIPGTRIIGGISIAAGGAGAYPETPILDENGHGTGVSSVAAGQFFGSNPNALIVMVEGLGTSALSWATSQPWIDVVSNSWGPGLPGRVDVFGDAGITRTATERGQSVLFSSGNGMYNTNSSTAFAPGGPVPDPCDCKIPPPNLSTTSYTSGPSWVLTIGAASPVNGQAHWWHGVPVDAASFGSKWRAADAFGVAREDDRDFGGTSCATPITGGVLTALILRAREVLGDTTAGQRPDGAVAVAGAGVTPPASGPLSDGVLTRAEAERVLLTSAQPVDFDPTSFSWDYAVQPTTDTYYVQQGYGIVDAGAKQRALAVLVGEQAQPDRTDVDTWMTLTDALRDALWTNL